MKKESSKTRLIRVEGSKDDSAVGWSVCARQTGSRASSCRMLVIGMTEWSAVAAVVVATAARSNESRYFAQEEYERSCGKRKPNRELYTFTAPLVLVPVDKEEDKRA